MPVVWIHTFLIGKLLLYNLIFVFTKCKNKYLNREPREFEYLRCLVDGSHWQGQKRLRKPDRSGKGGHLG